MKCSVSSDCRPHQNLDDLKPVYRKFPLSAYDRSARVKIFPKVGKLFFVRYSGKTGSIQLIGNPQVNERQEANSTQVYTSQSLKDLTNTRTDIVNNLTSVLSSNATLGKSNYLFEVLYDQKKRTDRFTFTDVHEFAGNSLRFEIYGKRLELLNQLKLGDKSTANVNVFVVTPKPDDLKLIQTLGYDTTSEKRETLWIRDLCETLQCRTIYTLKREGKRDTIGRYAIVGSAVRLERRKHIVRKTDYKDLKEVPKTLTDVIQAFMQEHQPTREDFVQNVQNKHPNDKLKAHKQLDFINRVKSGEAFRERLQQYEKGEIANEVRVYLVAASSKCQQHLKIFGYVKADSLTKRNITLPTGCEKLSTALPSHLSWAKSDELCTDYKQVEYFDGLVLADCVVPERYTGSSVAVPCHALKGFIATNTFLDDENLQRYVQVLPLPRVYKEDGSPANIGRRKRALRECSDQELVIELGVRVLKKVQENASKEETVVMGHLNKLGEYFEEPAGESIECQPDVFKSKKRRLSTSESSGRSSSSSSSSVSSSDARDEDDDGSASVSGDDEAEDGELVDSCK